MKTALFSLVLAFSCLASAGFSDCMENLRCSSGLPATTAAEICIDDSSSEMQGCINRLCDKAQMTIDQAASVCYLTTSMDTQRCIVGSYSMYKSNDKDVVDSCLVSGFF
jgi:hypothetical protein